MMFALAILAEVTSGLAGLVLLATTIRHLRRERHVKALAVTLMCFLLFEAAVLIFTLAPISVLKLFALQLAGFFALGLFAASTWSVQTLITEKTKRRWMAAGIGAGLLGFGYIHIKTNLIGLLIDAANNWEIVLTVGGKYFLAAVILGCVLFFGKFEALTTALIWRYDRRGANVAVTLLVLVLSILAFTSVSLAAGKINAAFFAGCQWLSVFFLSTEISALRHPRLVPAEQPATALRVSPFLSTGALIYGGIYLVIFGLLLKMVMVVGSDWRYFVSFFAALGGIVFAVALITGQSVRRRWTRFVERNLLAGAYDFRRELQNLTEAVATARDRDKLLQAVNHTLVDIFGLQHCCLWVAEANEVFRTTGLDENGEVAAGLELRLSERQAAWLSRVQQSFDVERLLELPEVDDSAGPLKKFLIAGRYEIGAVLFAGQCLLGIVWLGPKRSREIYSEEDRQLLELLGHAISISLHGANLQQRVLADRQMESFYRLTSFMMHDLRNTVATLSLLTQNANRHLENPAFRVEFLSALSRVVEEMQSLLYKLSAVKTGSELQHFVECDPTALIYDVLAELPIPPVVELEVEIASLRRAVWDKGQIRVVIRNLLINALEAMPAGGRLTVRGTQEHACIKLAVTDTGAGMSPDFMRQRLFKPNQTTKAKGLGIGLYQSREIILAHGGKIQVQSASGAGTTFELILPCLHEKAALQEKRHDVIDNGVLNSGPAAHFAESEGLSSWSPRREAGNHLATAPRTLREPGGTLDMQI